MRDRPGRGVENLLRRMAICREYCAAHKRGDSPPYWGTLHYLSNPSTYNATSRITAGRSPRARHRTFRA
jgi:hypothetical protein